MAFTLFDISYAVSKLIAPIFEGVATAGSATSITDTVRLQNVFGDDHFTLGTAWILYDAGGAGASPQGKMARITDFVQSTGVVTMTTVTDAVAAGDRYSLMNKRYDLDRIIANINTVLARLKVPTEDSTSLDTAADQLEYTLPAAVLDEEIEVFIQNRTNATTSNEWTRMHNWYIAETGTGVQKKLIFRSQPLYVRDLKIRYYLPHPALYVAADKLREGVSIEQVVYNAAAMTLRDEMNMMSSSDKALGARIQSLEEMARMWTPASNRQSHKLATFGTSRMSNIPEEG